MGRRHSGVCYETLSLNVGEDLPHEEDEVYEVEAVPAIFIHLKGE